MPFLNSCFCDLLIWFRKLIARRFIRVTVREMRKKQKIASTICSCSIKNCSM
jgi:hypothetical protein